VNSSLLRLSDGKIAFRVNFGLQTPILVVCPDNYPKDSPHLRASCEPADVWFDIHSLNERISEGWGKSFNSIYSIVKEIMRSSGLNP
jgi:hypothetical protein